MMLDFMPDFFEAKNLHSLLCCIGVYKKTADVRFLSCNNFLFRIKAVL